MADGDLILPLDFDESPDFPMGSCGRELYEALAPLAYDDEQHGWPLATLCEALGRMRQPISDLVRAWNEPGVEAYSGDTDTRVTVTMPRSGWSRAAHPNEAPGAPAGTGGVDLLPFVGQLVGVRGIEQLSNDDRREAIKRREGYSRGQLKSVLSAAARYTDGSGVSLRERYDPDTGSSAYHGQVVLKRSRVRELARVNMIANPRAEGPLTTVRLLATSTMQSPYLSIVDWTWTEDAEHGFRVTGTLPDDQSSGSVGIAFSDAGRAAHPVKAGLPYTASVLLAIVDESFLIDGIRWFVRWFDAGGALMATVPGTRWGTHDIWGFPFTSTWIAPPGARFGQFSVEQSTDFPNGDTITFDVTHAMLEQTSRAREFADALTPGWQPLGELNASPSRGPGIPAEEIAAGILRWIPAGLIYDVVFSDIVDYSELVAMVDARYPTYADVATRYTTYSKMQES